MTPPRHELCTTVDDAYLVRLLVLHATLSERTEFRLRVVCMDERTWELLERLALANVELIPVAEVERDDPELASVRSSRTLAEYCWTMKATLVARCFAREPTLSHLAYVDADHTFWSGVAPLLEELGDGNALLVPQRTDDDRVGQFNAGYVLFRRTEETSRLLAWWRERCLERCEADLDHIGDQPYLSEWPRRFDGVRVLEHPSGGLAPWSSDRVQLARAGARVTVDGRPLLFYHHQSFRIVEGRRWAKRLRLLGDRYVLEEGPVPFVWTIGRWYPFTAVERELIWEPYARRVSEALATLLALDRDYDPGYARLGPRAIGNEAVRSLVLRPARRVLARSEPADGRLPAHG